MIKKAVLLKRFNYGYDKWFKVEQHIDFDQDETKLYVDGKFVYRWPFSFRSTSKYGGNGVLDALNFYIMEEGMAFYVDNFYGNPLPGGYDLIRGTDA